MRLLERHSGWTGLAAAACTISLAMGMLSSQPAADASPVNPSSAPAPVLTWNGNAISWSSVAGATGYQGAVSTAPRGTTGRTTSYMALGDTTTWSPTAQPGKTLYYGVQATGPNGGVWSSTEVAITWPNPAPVLTLSGTSISWPSDSAASGFMGAISTAPRGAANRTTTYVDLGSSTSWTPPAQAGQMLYYGVAATHSGTWQWTDSEVSIAWPAATSDTAAATTSTTPPAAASTGPMAVGLAATHVGPDGAQRVAGIVGLDRLEVGGGQPASDFTSIGVKVDLLFSGPYNTGGVSALDPNSWASNAVGTFQSQCGGLALNCPAIEVLNEPWGPWFWGPNAQSAANEAAYGRLLVATWNAFHSKYGSASPKILAAYPSDSWWNGVKAGVPNVANYYDAITVHPYGGTSNVTQSAQGNRAQVAAAHNITGKPVWVTEIGWPTAVGKPSTGDSLQWTETQQAGNIYNFVKWARSTGYVDAVIFFTYGDYGTNMWYGVFRLDGRTPKPGYTALGQAAKQQPCTVCG
jgi:hypothetical protein